MSGVTAALAAGMSVLGFVGASHIPPGHADRLRALGVLDIVERMEELPAAVTTVLFNSPPSFRRARPCHEVTSGSSPGCAPSLGRPPACAVPRWL